MTSKITLPELKSLCKDNNIKGFSKLKKEEVIDLLKTNGVKIDTKSNTKVDTKSNTKTVTKAVTKSDIDEVSNDLKKMNVKETKKESKVQKDSKKTSKETKKEEILDDKMTNEVTEYYIFKDEKSEKFWEIKFEDTNDDKRKFIVRYGKVDTPGSRAEPKLDTITNIKKLIETKIKKGYVKD